MAKIMLVEDDKSLREIYGVRLAAEGYEIISAGDGEEALAMAVKEKPDLILSDVMMPKISGFDMLDIIRATPETKDLKIIMMTALSSEDQRARGESLGADKYLVKSQVGIEDVVRAVHEVIGDVPMPASPKPVEFTKPIATETIETTTTSETSTPTEPVSPVVEEAAPVQPVDTPAPPPTTQETSLPQPTAVPIVGTTTDTTTANPEATTVNIQPESTIATDQTTAGTTNVATNQSQPKQTVTEATVETVAPTVIPVEFAATSTPTEPISPVAQPVPVQPVDAPAPPPTTQETSLPQPTAPFSTAAPRSSLGERVINPLSPTEEKPDISSLINQELSNDTNTPPPPTP